MPLLLLLFLTFFKLGLFSFGGGYAMITLIQQEILHYGWLSESQFADIVAIAEMTPGPIAVNAATYVGYQTAGLAGGLIASAGVTLPSLLLALLVSRFILKYQRHPYIVMTFYGLRPVVIGLIFTAALVIGRTALLKQTQLGISAWIKQLMHEPLQLISPAAIVLFAICLLLAWRDKIHPLLLIFGSGLAGIILYRFGLFY